MTQREISGNNTFDKIASAVRFGSGRQGNTPRWSQRNDEQGDYVLLPDELSEKVSGKVIAVADQVANQAVKGVADHDEMEITDEFRKRTDRTHYTLHPSRGFLPLFHVIVGVLVLASAIMIPYECAFVRLEFGALLWVSLVFDAILFFDNLLQFFIQFPKDNDHFWITDNAMIARRYLCGEFLIDLISVVPFGFIWLSLRPAPAAHTVSKSIEAIEALRFVKLLRLMRIRRLSSFSSWDTTLTYAQRRFLWSLFQIILAAHCMGCFWGLLAADRQSWNWLNALEEREALRGINNKVSRWDSAGKAYVAALYWATFTLTGIGYGDIVPVTLVEYITATLCMVIAGLMWANVVASVVSIISLVASSDVSHRQLMDILNQACRHYSLDNQLRARLQQYFSKLKDAHTHHERLVLLLSMMSPQLGTEVVTVAQGAWIDNVRCLRGLERKSFFFMEFARNLVACMYGSKEHIKIKFALNVVQRGITVRSDGVVMVRNMVWGEDFILDNPQLRRNHTCVSLTYVDLLYIQRDALDKILKNYPREKFQVRKAKIRLACIRGIVLMARSELRRQTSTIQGVATGAESLSMAGLKAGEKKGSMLMQLHHRRSSIEFEIVEFQNQQKREFGGMGSSTGAGGTRSSTGLLPFGKVDPKTLSQAAFWGSKNQSKSGLLQPVPQDGYSSTTGPSSGEDVRRQSMRSGAGRTSPRDGTTHGLRARVGNLEGRITRIGANLDRLCAHFLTD